MTRVAACSILDTPTIQNEPHYSILSDMRTCSRLIFNYFGVRNTGALIPGVEYKSFSSLILSRECPETPAFQSLRVIRKACAEAMAVAQGVVRYWTLVVSVRVIKIMVVI
jgi:hypothetical protein